MPSLNIVSQSGAQQSFDAIDGISLMDAIKQQGFDELLALCGGCCSCATCHVYVDEAHLDALPRMSDAEDELLDAADDRRRGSRLSCQIPLTAALDGLTATIAAQSTD